MTQHDRYKFVLRWFGKNVPVAETELHYDNPFQLLVAVILSAQCTDKRVNMVTPALFCAFPEPAKMAAAAFEDMEPFIRSVTFANNKTRHLMSMAKMLHEQYQDSVPDTMEELTKLPGVGRKTANVIISVVFQKPGMAVDTHVFRVSARIGLTLNAKNPLQAENQLTAHIPARLLPIAHHWLILHGRYTCTARKPHCTNCGLMPACIFGQSAVNVI